MNRCSRWETSLFLHAHGQLHGLSRALAESHLQGCDSCRACWARWVVERDTMRGTFAPIPVAGMEESRTMDAVGARIRSEPREASFPRERARPGGTRRFGLAVSGVLAAACLAAAAASVTASWVRAFGSGHVAVLRGHPGTGIAQPVSLAEECFSPQRPGSPLLPAPAGKHANPVQFAPGPAPHEALSGGPRPSSPGAQLVNPQPAVCPPKKGNATEDRPATCPTCGGPHPSRSAPPGGTGR